MQPVLPPRFLFRFSIPVRRIPKLPLKGGRLLNLPDRCTLPEFGDLDGAPAFAEIRAAWNENGIGFAVEVAGKKHPHIADPAAPLASDGLQIWIDTRNTQSIHRASRFCHHFCLLPAGAGAKSDKPIGIQLPIARAREEQSRTDSAQIPIAAEHRRDGYRLEAWLPAEVLTGYDPQSNPLLGFYYSVRDAELGEQFLSVGHEFPFAHDPSLWSTLELQP
jgi:hypothetical protein